MMRTLSLGISPCPNDTYIFGALALGLVKSPGLGFSVDLQDVETLNRAAADGRFDVIKLSAAAAAQLLDSYALLPCGGALGRGCGPLVVVRPGFGTADLRNARVAIPGRLTTAARLLHLTGLHHGELLELRYDEVMPAVAAGTVDAGVVIHEGRFTYGALGLELLLDLGAWWEAETGLPIPLGVIGIRRELGPQVAGQVAEGIRASLAFARQQDAAIWPYIVQHAQEMDPAVIHQHINMFVTDFSMDLGPEGQGAVARLLGRKAEDIFVAG